MGKRIKNAGKRQRSQRRHIKVKEEKQNELKIASKAEDEARTALNGKDKEKNVALDELRAQLNGERDKAVNNCMKTSMGEMQKALKKAREDKEAALTVAVNGKTKSQSKC